ncbi:MAG TPA: TetR family transcriptional regulator C-terminal domain-containing protein [Nocardioides sp.]|uniref:TetR/AcrR family transcriptional regulator n=1 Tax=Nocardioides sp. TaxID=35761 RepID=UPI002F4260BA
MSASQPAKETTPKTRRGQASRERLVEAAVQSVVDHGIHQMRLDEVLTSAGSSKSQMYHYFSDRDALVEAAVAHRCDEFLGQLGPAFESVSALSDLKTLLRAFAAEYARELKGCPIGTLAGELSSGPEPARQLVVEAFAAWENHLERALQRIKAAGELRADADTGHLALGLLTALEGGMFLSQVRNDPTPLEVALDGALDRLASLRE